MTTTTQQTDIRPFAVRLIPSKGNTAEAESVALFTITGRDVHSRGRLHRVVRFAGKPGLYLIAQDGVIALNSVPTTDYEAGKLRPGDQLVVDGSRYTVTARKLADPILVPVDEPAPTRFDDSDSIKLYVGSLMPGDVFTWGNVAGRVASNVWADIAGTRNAGRHLYIEDGPALVFPSKETVTEVTLHSRENYGPLRATYTVGDRVNVYWVDEDRTGVVIEVHTYPDHNNIDTTYVVHTAPGGSAYVGAEHMRAEPTPAPAPGQFWTSAATGHVAEVAGVAPDSHGLIAVCAGKLGTVILSSPGWQPMACGDCGALLVKREPGTPEQAFVGTTLACPNADHAAHRCLSTVSVPSPQLRAQLAEQAAADANDFRVLVYTCDGGDWRALAETPELANRSDLNAQELANLACSDVARRRPATVGVRVHVWQGRQIPSGQPAATAERPATVAVSSPWDAYVEDGAA